MAATLLTGVLQIFAGWLRLGVLMRFVSRSVLTGFVNALAILIFMAQLPELIGAPWMVFAMVAAGLGIMSLFPLLTRAVPSPVWRRPPGWTYARWVTWGSCPTTCRYFCCLMSR